MERYTNRDNVSTNPVKKLAPLALAADASGDIKCIAIVLAPRRNLATLLRELKEIARAQEIHTSKLPRRTREKLKEKIAEHTGELLAASIHLQDPLYKAAYRLLPPRASKKRARQAAWSQVINHIKQLVQQAHSPTAVTELHIDRELAEVLPQLAQAFPNAAIQVKGELYMVADIIAYANYTDPKWPKRARVKETRIRL